MSVHTKQTAHLRHTIENARKIESELAVARQSRLGEVHFRPSCTGIAMVGLLPDRPQLGKSRISVKLLKTSFEQEFETHCVQRTVNKPAPEKQLQSYLIANAYRNDRKFSELVRENENEELVFVTDELRLPTEGDDVICDILALQGDQPVVIELKSERRKEELVKQVTKYSSVVESHLQSFSDLYSVILQRRVSLQNPCRRLIVWPHLPGHDQDPNEASLAQLGIRVVEYTNTQNGFTFRVGKPIRHSTP